MAVIRVESLGSVWLIDETTSRYQRLPRFEQPRYADGPLTDGIWHPYRSWRVDEYGFLRIVTPAGLGIAAKVAAYVGGGADAGHPADGPGGRDGLAGR